MTLAISPAHKLARLTGTLTFADVGPQNSRIRLYATTQPATGGDPGGGLLVEILLAKPCGEINASVLTLKQFEPLKRLCGWRWRAFLQPSMDLAQT